MLKYDIKVIASVWTREGYLRPGERGVFAQPIPIHISVTHDHLTLVYLLDDYSDHRSVVPLRRTASGKGQTRFGCPQCSRTAEWIVVSNDGQFVCERCALGRKGQIRPTTGALRDKAAWEIAQDQIEALRRQLGDETSAIDDIPWPSTRMSHKRWLTLLDELEALEARKLTLYAEHLTRMFDTIKKGEPLGRRRKARTKRA
jgi:hypothetical protein